VFRLYKELTKKYEVSFKFSQDELAHHLLPRNGVVMTLVVENDDENGNRVLTDFISYYHLPSQILKCKDVPHDYKTMHVSTIYFIHIKSNSTFSPLFRLRTFTTTHAPRMT